MGRVSFAGTPHWTNTGWVKLRSVLSCFQTAARRRNVTPALLLPQRSVPCAVKPSEGAQKKRIMIDSGFGFSLARPCERSPPDCFAAGLLKALWSLTPVAPSRQEPRNKNRSRPFHRAIQVIAIS